MNESKYPLCFIDTDGEGGIALSIDEKQTAIGFRAERGSPLKEYNKFEVDIWLGRGARKLSHADFLRECDGEPIADKLREILREQGEATPVEEPAKVESEPTEPEQELHDYVFLTDKCEYSYSCGSWTRQKAEAYALGICHGKECDVEIYVKVRTVKYE